MEPFQAHEVLAITGAANGIGSQVARLAAQSGRTLALLDRDAEAANRLATELGDARVLALPCDVSHEEQVEAAFARIRLELGTLTALVTCAGIDRAGEVHNLDASTWDEVMSVNLRGTFLATRAAARQMLPGGGSIVCVSSPLALASTPCSGAYSASKAGVCALVRALALDYASRGIRVNAVLPGPTETDLMWAGVPAGEQAQMRETIALEVPLGRLAHASEPARAILWLLSEEASFVTGAQLACDGGVLAKSSVSV